MDPANSDGAREINRRNLIKWGAASAAVPALGVAAYGTGASGGGSDNVTAFSAQQAPFPEIEEVTVAEMRASMDAGRLTSRQLVEMYLARIDAIDRNGPKLNSIMELNPDALAIADELDRELAAGSPRGPLHGIPILLKDNIDTADQMLTTAGSLALAGSRPLQDSTTAARLRAAGAVILGKTTLSEWANFRSTHSSSGWSGRGGQALNPYVLDVSPCGSSSGSPAAVAANLTAVAIGTETDGSIVCPSNASSVVGIKPTVGLTSRAGVIPISHTQDTIGPHGRTVADAAVVLGALVGPDPRDPQTQESAGRFETDYTRFLDARGLSGARIGVPRSNGYTGYSTQADAIFEAAIEAMRALGAEIVDPAEFPNQEEMGTRDELLVLLYEFKADLNAYLASRGPESPMQTLADLIQFNADNAEQEMPYFAQELFDLAQEKGPLTDQEYLDAVEKNSRLSREEGIDALMDLHQLDAIIAPTGSPSWKIDLVNGDHFLGASSGDAAMAGYPIVTLPMGYAYGLPIGISFIGRAYSEPTLIKLAYAFEQATQVRERPKFLPSAVVPSGLVSDLTLPMVAGTSDPRGATPFASPVATLAATPDSTA